MWYPTKEILLDTYVVDECSPLVPVSRLLEHSGFVYSFGCAEGDSGENIHKAIYLGSGLMWNDDYVCGGKRWVKIWMRDSSEL